MRVGGVCMDVCGGFCVYDWVGVVKVGGIVCLCV